MPTKREGLPGTLERSPREAQRTYAETLDSAEELLQRARRLGVKGRSTMTKEELARAIARKQD